jgi:hypothetical protein
MANQPPITEVEWYEHKIGPEIDGSLISNPGRRTRMDSVSRVAIRNIKPPQVDTNDPDQKKLIEHLNHMEGEHDNMVVL